MTKLLDANAIIRFLLNDIPVIAYNKVENIEIFSFDKKLNNQLSK